jgi:tripartite-type tricarboxylate transporter receptor subunit TctC
MPTRAVFRSLLLAATCIISTPAIAQDYPNRPITLVVPFPPGGSTTIVGRIVAEKMEASLGQSIVVVDRGGAGGTIGTRSVGKAAPDGYTILLGYTGTLAISPHVYPDPGYDPRTDFSPIGRIGTAPNTLVVHPSFPVKSVGELVAHARRNPGKIDYGSAGVGSVSHVCGEYFATTAGIKLNHVPYKGTGPAVSDLLGGHILVAFAPLPATHEHAKNGKLRMLAVTSAKRSSLAPDVPTIAEAGVSGFAAELRYGLVAPARTPRGVIERLNRALRDALATDDVRKRLAIEGAEPLPSTPEEYAADIDREVRQWGKVVKASGAKAE